MIEHITPRFIKTESIQYNAVLAITGAVRGTLREKLYLRL